MNRKVFCLLGLPIDIVSMRETVDAVRAAIREQRRLFVSTPNLNFLIACQADEAFRRSVIESDLSVADGMPLVWMSRMLGIPLPERVTGSGLFESLRGNPPPPGDTPIRVFIFGGPPGAAQAAGERINAHSPGMRCVGYETPGFGSVADMSGDDLMQRIEQSGADFLLVALSAQKAQAWIMHNRARLTVPVICNMGAVVNFEAGTVRRAPLWLQRTGLEWVWRIREEPMLWRRYWRDGKACLRLAFLQLLPYVLWLRLHRPAPSAQPVIQYRHDAQGSHVAIVGSVPDSIPQALRESIDRALAREGDLTIDLTALTYLGPCFAGEMLTLESRLKARGDTLRLVGLSARTRRLLDWNGIRKDFPGAA